MWQLLVGSILNFHFDYSHLSSNIIVFIVGSREIQWAYLFHNDIFIHKYFTGTNCMRKVCLYNLRKRLKSYSRGLRIWCSTQRWLWWLGEKDLIEQYFRRPFDRSKTSCALILIFIFEKDKKHNFVACVCIAILLCEVEVIQVSTQDYPNHNLLNLHSCTKLTNTWWFTIFLVPKTQAGVIDGFEGSFYVYCQMKHE